MLIQILLKEKFLHNFTKKIDQKYLDLNEIKNRIDLGKDIIGRNDTFQKIEIDSTFPDYINENKSIYKDWIKL